MSDLSALSLTRRKNIQESSRKRDQDEDSKRLFSCPYCGNTFAYKHVMQNHTRIHTGEKPFKCDICARAFTRDHHLKVHQRLHTGEKPCVCICEKGFVQVANLRRHEKSCKELKARRNAGQCNSSNSSTNNISESSSSDSGSPTIISPQESPMIALRSSRVIMPLPTYPASVFTAYGPPAVQNYHLAGVIDRHLLQPPFQTIYSFFPVYSYGLHVQDDVQEIPEDLSMKSKTKKNLDL